MHTDIAYVYQACMTIPINMAFRAEIRYASSDLLLYAAYDQMSDNEYNSNNECNNAKLINPC